MQKITKASSNFSSYLLVMIIGFLGISSAFAAGQVVNLIVSYKTVIFAGKSVKAIAVNNQIPAPTLRFKEGDHVTINVRNQLNDCALANGRRFRN